MADYNQVASIFGDKEMLQDSLISQKLISDSYNSFAGECVNEQLRGAMLDILKEEHCIQADIFTNLQDKGWYKTEPADQNKVTQTKQKYSVAP